jgi:vacuolar-type H+-ATPase subunit H
VRDINASFEIRDGRIYLQPFDTKLGPAKANISGDQGIDQTMNYVLKLAIPRNEFGSAANDVYEGLLSQASSKGFDISKSENVNVNMTVTGTFSDPKIGMDAAQSLKDTQADIKNAVMGKINAEAGKVKDEAKQKASEEADRILKDAEKKAAALKSEAKTAGDKLVSEAQSQGDKLIREAGNNPLKKAAAEKTAAGMVKKAKQQSDNLVKEADTKADALMQEAHKKADALR